MRDWSTWLLSAHNTYKPHYVFLYEIYEPCPDQSDNSIPSICALIPVQTLDMRGRSTWLISARNTYKPHYVFYMRSMNHTLTNQISCAVIPVIHMYTLRDQLTHVNALCFTNGNILTV